MQMINNIYDYILFLPDFKDEKKTKEAKSILAIFIIGITCAVSMTAYYLFIGLWFFAAVVSAVILVALYCLSLLRKGEIEKSAIFAALSIIFALTLAITFESGLYDPGILVIFPLLVFLSGYIGKKQLYLLGAGLFAWVWLLYLLEIIGYYELRRPIIDPFDITLLTSIIFVFSMALLQITYQRMRSINEGLQLAKESAESASQAKSNFLTMTSHELRTPLNAVIGYSEFLIEELTEEGKLTDDHLEDLSNIKKSGSNLLNLINDILDLSKIEMGQVDVQLSPVCIPDLVKDVIKINSPMAKRNRANILLQNDLLTDQEHFKTDRGKLEQVLINLISNAVKFTEDGRITVRLYASRFEAEPQLCISIEDTGIGIPKESVPIIFEAFQQADSSLSRIHGGTGLGLAIARNLVNLLNGTIVVDSQVDVGSTFIIRLPYNATLQ